MTQEMTFGELAQLRRLHFEASAIVMAELKSKATDTTGDGGRKLPVAEKNARLLEQEGRLPGLKIRGELQPSFRSHRSSSTDEGDKLCDMDTTQ